MQISDELLGDGAPSEASLLNGCVWIIEGLGWEASHELIASIDRCYESNVSVQVRNFVIHVDINSCTLAVVEAELDLRLRLTLINDRLSTCRRCIYGASLRRSATTKASSLARETDILRGRRWPVVLTALVLESN